MKPRLNKDETKVTYDGKTFDVETMKNGAKYFMKPYTTKDGKKGARPLILKGAPRSYLNKIRSKSRSSRRSQSGDRNSLKRRNLSAMRAFVRHYEGSSYNTEKGRKIAITRDLRQDN